MKDAIPAIRNYKIWFTDGYETDVPDANNDPNFEDKLRSGEITVYGPDSKPRAIGPYTVKNIIPFIAQECAHCNKYLSLHPGENVCPACDGRTWLPAKES